ncbi:MAG: quinone oxidoreductase [Rhodospirillales bacterium]|jgi:NADPH:quinone reductase|nr:quinone oxidoreductase [Rhodospirillales bacterium]
MTKAIQVNQYGGPEVLEWNDVALGDPGPGEARVRHTAVGLNFIDTYMRTGLYPLPGFPSGIGLEGAGIVEAVGEGVTDVKVGGRVAYAGGPPGAYSEARVMPVGRLIPIPHAIEDQTAAAMMLKGMTAQYLLRQTYVVKAGDTILTHAAAGGVGLILCQWAKHLGATVIGTVGSDEKAELAKANGCDHPIIYTRENFTERVREITDGKGVPVVYDSVGAATWEGSLDCLQPRGLMVSFGNASGKVEPVEPVTLSAKGSLFLTRPTLIHYTATRAELLATAGDLFDVVGPGHVKISVNQTYDLADAAQSHRDLEGRKTTGSTVLLT